MIKIINEFIVDNELVIPEDQFLLKEIMKKNYDEKVYIGEILGEEVS